MQKTEQRKLTPEQARSFPKGERLSSAVILLGAARERAKAGVHPNCKCNPYEDWFTFKRWLAQGMQVQRGERGVKLPILIEQERKQENGEVLVFSRPWTASVFCRCQVKNKEENIGRRA